MKALIDGDMILYSATLACEVETIFDDDFHILYSDYNRCRDAADDMLQMLLEDSKCDDYLIMFSGKENWRKDVMPGYKEHRKTLRKPVCFGRLKEDMLADSRARMIEPLEADDLMGMKATEEPGEWVVISHDKDFLTIPGHFQRYQAGTGLGHLKIISREVADYWHLIQAFMGDRVDGYPGCPGVGLKTARKLLDPHLEYPGSIQDGELLLIWDLIVDQYERKGLTREFALQNAQVARILRHIDCEIVDGEPEITLWNPAVVPF